MFRDPFSAPTPPLFRKNYICYIGNRPSFKTPPQLYTGAGAHPSKSGGQSGRDCPLERETTRCRRPRHAPPPGQPPRAGLGAEWLGILRQLWRGNCSTKQRQEGQCCVCREEGVSNVVVGGGGGGQQELCACKGVGLCRLLFGVCVYCRRYPGRCCGLYQRIVLFVCFASIFVVELILYCW